MMRRILGGVLLVLLAAAPVAAADALQSGTVYVWEGKDVLLIPADQATTFDRSTAGGREIMVVVPYDRYAVVAQQTPPATSSGVTASQSFPGFPKDHVVLLVPSGQVKQLSQLSPGDQPIFVVMPLEEYNRLAAVPATSGTRTSAMEPAKEPTSFSSAPSAAPAYAAGPGQTFALRSLGESNAVDEIYPAAGGTVITLRDGTVLLVPESVNLPSTLTEGSRIRGEFEQRDGRNLMVWLDEDFTTPLGNHIGQ
jgi:hypothetical protein